MKSIQQFLLESEDDTIVFRTITKGQVNEYDKYFAGKPEPQINVDVKNDVKVATLTGIDGHSKQEKPIVCYYNVDKNGGTILWKSIREWACYEDVSIDEFKAICQKLKASNKPYGWKPRA